MIVRNEACNFNIKEQYCNKCGQVADATSKTKTSNDLQTIIWGFYIVPGAGVENMDIVKCENKFLNPYYRCILLKYK